MCSETGEQLKWQGSSWTRPVDPRAMLITAALKLLSL